MKTICAWCHRHLSGNPECEDTSHGICGACLAREIAEAEREANQIRRQDPAEDPWQDYGGEA